MKRFPAERPLTPDERPLTPVEREAIHRSVISSEALSGVVVPREVAERALDKVMREPLLDIGGEE